MTLSEIGNVPIDFSVLKSMFPNHKSVHNKISDMEKSGIIIRLKKGMYVVSPKESGQLISLELVANHIYGPSYVSMESALRYYGLIPESVYTTKSMSIKHSRKFDNELGRFEYIKCEKEYFSIGIKQEILANASFLIAQPEKALCDLIIYSPSLNLRSQKDVLIYLEENLRFDMESLYKMDKSILEQCVKKGRKKAIIANILKIIER